jgi:hypothetical protein
MWIIVEFFKKKHQNHVLVEKVCIFTTYIKKK